MTSASPGGTAEAQGLGADLLNQTLHSNKPAGDLRAQLPLHSSARVTSQVAESQAGCRGRGAGYEEDSPEEREPVGSLAFDRAASEQERFQRPGQGSWREP